MHMRLRKSTFSKCALSGQVCDCLVKSRAHFENVDFDYYKEARIIYRII